MDFDYFQMQEPNTANLNYVRQQNTNDDEFIFQNEQNSQPTIQPSMNYSYSTTLMTNQEENEIARRVREEQEKINQKLRAKAEDEYKQKQARKEEGSRQIQEFFDKKEREKNQRKQENSRNQQESKKKIKSQSLRGWRKVAANVPLKQGQHKGSKDINRMRQAIIRKRDDQK